MSRVPWAWSSSLLTETQLQGHVFVRATFPWKRNCFIVSGRANAEYHPTRRVTRQRARTSRRFAGAEVRLRVFLGLLWFVLCRHLSGEWRINEQYNYGWFVPFFAA